MSQYLVSHGKSGAFGLFTPAQPMRLERGARVVVASPRGVEAGTVLCPASAGHVEKLGASAGQLLRLVTAEDEAGLARLGSLSQQFFCRQPPSRSSTPYRYRDRGRRGSA